MDGWKDRWRLKTPRIFVLVAHIRLTNNGFGMWLLKDEVWFLLLGVENHTQKEDTGLKRGPRRQGNENIKFVRYPFSWLVWSIIAPNKIIIFESLK